MNILTSRITWIWALLVAVTCLSWESVQAFHLFSDMRWSTTLVLLMAFLKVRFIMMDFMELRQAPLLLRTFSDVWCVSVCGILIGLYWLTAVYMN